MLLKKNLMELMGITEEDINLHQHSFNFSATDIWTLQSFSPKLEPELERIVSEFYKREMANDEIAAMIGAPETLAKLHIHMRFFLTQLFQATYDDDYINSRLRIGKVHKRMGVTPKLYMKALSTLQETIDQNIDRICTDESEVKAVKQAFHKALLFDCQFVFQAYIHSYQEEMEQAHDEIRAFASHLDIKIEALTQKLYDESLRDSLTKLYNRRALIDYLEREFEIAKRFKLRLCLAYFDLNRFKAVNDRFGHQAGDEVLAQVGRSLLSISRNVDIPARIGGDEFCILMPRCDLESARRPIERLTQNFDQNCNFDVTFSIGLVQAGPDDFEEIPEFMQRADRLMYEAKAASKKSSGHFIRPL